MKKQCIHCWNSFAAVRSDQMFCSPECRYCYHHSGPIILPTQKQWFDMILAREKKEEYRERKEYWQKRFQRYFGYGYGKLQDGSFGYHFSSTPKEVIFRNGYQKNAPEFHAMVTISEGEGKPEWGAEPGMVYYVLMIHEVFGEKNIRKMVSAKMTIQKDQSYFPQKSR